MDHTCNLNNRAVFGIVCLRAVQDWLRSPTIAQPVGSFDADDVFEACTVFILWNHGIHVVDNNPGDSLDV